MKLAFFKMLYVGIWSAFILVVSLIRTNASSPTIFQQKLTVDAPVYNGVLGESLDIDGDFAIVGKFGFGGHSGRAYIFRWNGSNWIEQQELIPSDGFGGNYYGYEVAISGNLAVVGANFGWPNDVGAAYIYEFDGTSWNEKQKVHASDSSTADNFGNGLDVYGDTIIIGAWASDGNGTNSGSAYAFVFDGSFYVQVQKIISTDISSYHRFGMSVSMTKGKCLIGAPHVPNGGVSIGAAYVFRNSNGTWVQQQKVMASDGNAGDNFGTEVAIYEDKLLVGAPWDDEYFSNSGSAYFFRFDGTSFVEVTRMNAHDPQLNTYYGWNIAIDDTLAVIGAHANSTLATQCGRAYLYDLNSPNQDLVDTLDPFDPTSVKLFGSAVGIFEDRILIGANNDLIIPWNNQGSVYPFLVRDTCETPQNLTTTFLSLQSVLLDWDDVPCADSFLIEGGLDYPNSDTVSLVVSTGDSELYVAPVKEGAPYRWRVKAFCNDGSESGFSASETFEIPICFPPYILTTTGITNNEAILNWNPRPNALEYVIYAQVSGLPTIYEITVPATQTSYNTGPILFPNTTYIWAVKTVCDPTGLVFSAVSFPATFTTLPSAFEKATSQTAVEEVRIFPNPMTSHATLDLSGFPHEEVEVGIFDIAGNEIRTMKFQGSTQALIDRRGLPSGVYLIHVSATESIWLKLLIE